MNQLTKDLLVSLASIRKIDINQRYLTNLNFNEMQVLLLLKKHINRDDIIMSDISDELKITRSAISQIVNKLEEKELVERYTHKNERKKVYIKITKLGNDIFEAELDRVVKAISKAVKTFGSTKTLQLIALLNEFYQTLSAELEEERTIC